MFLKVPRDLGFQFVRFMVVITCFRSCQIDTLLGNCNAFFTWKLFLIENVPQGICKDAYNCGVAELPEQNKELVL